MSDKPKKEAPAAEAGGAVKKKGLLARMPVLLGGVMVVEAAVLLAGVKLLGGGPAAAQAVELLGAHGEAGDEAGADHAAADESHGEAAGDAHGSGHDAPADAGHGDAHGEAAAAAADAHGETKAAKAEPPIDPRRSVEVEIVEFRAPNNVSGRAYLYDVAISAMVKGANKKKVEEQLKDRAGLIRDRVRTIIAQSDPAKLGGGAEPGLETLKRQVKFQLDAILGTGMIEEVLVPRCIPFRSDF